MLPKEIDKIFPFVVLFYGFFMVFVIENPWLEKVKGEFAQSLRDQLNSKKLFAWVCFFVGGLWSLQSILFS